MNRKIRPPNIRILQKSLGDKYVVRVEATTPEHSYFFIEWVLFQDSDRFNPNWERGRCRWATHELLTPITEL